MSEFQSTTQVSSADENPLLSDWNEEAEFGMPPFTSAKPEHFESALQSAMKQHLVELKSIASNTEEASFENTIAALDQSGELFFRVHDMFDNLCSSNGVPELQKVELKMAGPIANHFNQLFTFPGLFKRIQHVHASRQDSALGLTAEQIRLVERFHLDFERHGAKLNAEEQQRYAKIVEQQAELCTKFTQNILADESDVYLTIDSEEDQAGLPSDLIASAKQAAADRNLPTGTHIITLSRSLVEPFITFSERRDLREKAWKLWTTRGELAPERDNLSIAAQILKLRVEQARMHGYETYAHYATADTMAGSPDRVMELLERVWPAAKESVDNERHELERFIRESNSADTTTATAASGTAVGGTAAGGTATDGTVDGSSIKIEPWDWRYYAEKVRQSKYDLDDGEVKPYFPLDRMVEAIFDCANKLFGLTFKLRPDIEAYHPDVKVYEVHELNKETGEDELVAIFLHDNFARPNKRSGAWMSEYRGQHRNGRGRVGQRIVPIIVNNNNFNKGSSPAEPTLLSFDDAVTLFHEFGHGLHGMLSDVRYRRLAGTSVLRDFVELPSQLYEHWLSETVVLKKHARHYITNEPIPDELLQRLMRANKFNQGFDTVEYTASALVDVALHRLTGSAAISDGAGITKFEKQELDRLGMPQGIMMRHRPAHFQHLFAGSGYASAYYVYLWAEVLDADGFDAFLEAGDCFDRATADRVRRHVYAAGNSVDPAATYRLFRGRDPAIEPMLKKKGLL